VSAPSLGRDPPSEDQDLSFAFPAVPLSAVPNSTAYALHPPAIYRVSAIPILLVITRPILSYTVINSKCDGEMEKQYIAHRDMQRHFITGIPSHSVGLFLHKSINCIVSVPDRVARARWSGQLSVRNKRVSIMKPCNIVCIVVVAVLACDLYWE
jgi:hypothetical protein